MTFWGLYWLFLQHLGAALLAFGTIIGIYFGATASLGLIARKLRDREDAAKAAIAKAEWDKRNERVPPDQVRWT